MIIAVLDVLLVLAGGLAAFGLITALWAGWNFIDSRNGTLKYGLKYRRNHGKHRNASEEDSGAGAGEGCSDCGARHKHIISACPKALGRASGSTLAAARDQDLFATLTGASAGQGPVPLGGIPHQFAPGGFPPNFSTSGPVGTALTHAHIQAAHAKLQRASSIPPMSLAQAMRQLGMDASPTPGPEPYDGIVRAYRFFSVTDGGLVGSAGGLWEGPELEAKCQVGHGGVVIWRDDATGQESVSTKEDLLSCSCGIYGSWDWADARNYVDSPVLAACLFWGKMEVGTLGLRAERCRIERIWTTSRVAQLIARDWDVPCELVDSLPDLQPFRRPVT